MELGSRIEFHSHSILSDGQLLPAALIREAEIRNHAALAITDHVDASNLKNVVTTLCQFAKEMKGKLSLIFIPGVEVSYIKPEYFKDYCRQARRLGAKLIVVHGESPVEPVYPGTNHAAVSEKGLVDILAHPGYITDEDAQLAALNGVFLELTARRGHKNGNEHVARMAKKYGAKLIVDTDCHNETDLITQEQAFALCQAAGLSDSEALTAIKDNPQALLKRLKV